jgi:hypothetical protein
LPNPVRHLVTLVAIENYVIETATGYVSYESLTVGLIVASLGLIPAAHYDSSTLGNAVIHTAHGLSFFGHGMSPASESSVANRLVVGYTW